MLNEPNLLCRQHEVLKIRSCLFIPSPLCFVESVKKGWFVGLKDSKDFIGPLREKCPNTEFFSVFGHFSSNDFKTINKILAITMAK